jgi:hypothetical protein
MSANVGMSAIGFILDLDVVSVMVVDLGFD